MTVLETENIKTITVEQFVDVQTRAVEFLVSVMTGETSGSEDELKARIIAAQTLIGSEAPLDTQAFIERVREQLHDELRAAGLDVDGALGEKKVLL